MVTTPTRGDINWDVSLNAALNDLQTQITTDGSNITALTSRVSTLEVDGNFRPSDHNLLTWTMDPATCRSGGEAITSGTVYLAKVKIAGASVTASNILVSVVTVGATLTANQNFAGLYTASGTLLVSSADQSTAWTSLGLKTMVIAPQVLAVGSYYIALLSNGTTPPAFMQGNGASSSGLNAGLTVSTGRFLTGPTAQTTLPASITMASNSTTVGARWGALS